MPLRNFQKSLEMLTLKPVSHLYKSTHLAIQNNLIYTTGAENENSMLYLNSHFDYWIEN